MSNLNVDQKNIYTLLSDDKTEFLIPDYQRPYAWEEEQCRTLWDDVFAFAFPNDNTEEFRSTDEYFLGSIVTYKNDEGKDEVIDGQQRLTTLLLLLRAFYDRFEHMQDQNSKSTRGKIERCIWKSDEFGTLDKNSLKIDSEVATDTVKEELIELLKSGKVAKGGSSQYYRNYLFFQNEISKFLNTYPAYFAYFPSRLMGNCILLPIEAESQDTALRIFSTLNDRGLPLSDADIFKAQFYKYYRADDKRTEFIETWKDFEDTTSRIFNPSTGTPMDELFARYMYFLRAKQRNKNTTTESLRRFYEHKKYEHLRNDTTLINLSNLLSFWQKVSEQNEDWSDQVLKLLFVLDQAPNGMWQYIASVYYMRHNKDGKLEESHFVSFLRKITAFIFAYTITNPGVNALRAPLYEEMITIIDGDNVDFTKYRFIRENVHTALKIYRFVNQRPITRSILTWYAFTFEEQKLIPFKEVFDLEHIYSRKRHELERPLSDDLLIESLGNKILLEQSINIRASDYSFADKRRIYRGELRRGNNRKPSSIYEISELSSFDNFDEACIVDREEKIINRFLNFLDEESLFA